jgi:hypothetical protein
MHSRQAKHDKNSTTRDKHMKKSISGPATSAIAGIAAALLALTALAWVALRPVALPVPARADAASAEFSTLRALDHVRVLADKPRPIASAANAEARQYIVDQLRAIGLEPEVQTATAQKNTVDRRRNMKVVLGVVNNIIVRKPGTAIDHASRPTLLLATSYDTTERSVGASASAAPVAAMLESLRVLQAGAPLANDLIVLIADGERVGGLGARAFAGQHRLAKQSTLVIRFDSGGSRGPMVLIGASGIDGAAIKGWAQAAPHARGSSAMQAVYQMMPGALEMGALDTLGSARLHFANVEGSNGSGLGSRDTAGRLDSATVQSMGDTMLAMARHFGQAPAAAAAASNVVYFNLPGIGAVSYSSAAGWAFTRLACLMFVIVCCMAVQRGDVAPGEIINAAMGFVFIAALLLLSAFLVWQMFPSLHHGYDARAYGAGTRDYWFLAGFSALGTGLFVLLQRAFRRNVGNAAAALGPLLAMMLLLLLSSWKLPEASYVLTWPLIGTLLAYAALYLPGADRWSGRRRVLILCAGVTPAMVLIAPLVMDVFTATSPEHMNLPMATLALLLGMASVLLTAQRRFVVRGLAATSIACFAVASSAAPYGAEPIPQPNRMVYLKDATTWKSYWMMADVPLDDWSRSFFPHANRPQVQVDAFGHGGPKLWLAAAPPTLAGFPALVVLKDDDNGDRRQVQFTLQAKPSVPFIDVTLSGADALRASVNGRALTGERSAAWTLNLYGMGGQKLDFRFDLEPDRQARVLIHERAPGLPPHDLPPRPAGMLPQMTPMTETTIWSDTLLFR